MTKRQTTKVADQPHRLCLDFPTRQAAIAWFTENAAAFEADDDDPLALFQIDAIDLVGDMGGITPARTLIVRARSSRSWGLVAEVE